MRTFLREIYYYIVGSANLCAVFVAHYCFNQRKLLKYKSINWIKKVLPSFFVKAKESIIRKNIEEISQKDSVHVLFCLYTASMWSLGGLYVRMKQSAKFKPLILVAPFAGIEPAEARNKTFEETKDYFISKGYPVVTPLDDSFDIKSYDIVFFTTPYDFATKQVNILELPLNKLICYTSYSYMLSNRMEKFELPAYQLSWLYFCDSEFYANMVRTKSKVYTGNALYCGFAKIDQFYQTPTPIKRDKKTIIYAPHHSVSREGIKSATFDVNHEMLFELATLYQNDFYWIIKPHPLLRYHSVLAGVFKDETEYDDYMRRWDNSGFSKVIEKGEYWDAFKQSDAMITDSVSFLAEYQFTGKPLLLLESGEQTYNEFGQSIVEILYRCKGNDKNAIEEFMYNVNNGIDTMKEIRERFFDNNLSYYEKGAFLASDNIYKIINSRLS